MPTQHMTAFLDQRTVRPQLLPPQIKPKADCSRQSVKLVWGSKSEIVGTWAQKTGCYSNCFPEKHFALGLGLRSYWYSWKSSIFWCLGREARSLMHLLFCNWSLLYQQFNILVHMFKYRPLPATLPEPSSRGCGPRTEVTYWLWVIRFGNPTEPR